MPCQAPGHSYKTIKTVRAVPIRTFFQLLAYATGTEVSFFHMTILYDTNDCLLSAK